jgi:hypothetical protein
MSARTTPRDVHVRISRLVVDRTALSASGGVGLSERLADRISGRIAGSAPVPDAAGRSALIDAIADAVSAQVSPHVTTARKR